MVRANELGCRNGWDADLWVPADTDDSAQPSHALQPIGDRARAEAEPVEQNDLITSIVAARSDNLSIPAKAEVRQIENVEEDIFVKQSPSLTWSNGPLSPQSASDLVQDPKAAILRARDQFRQRRKTEGRLADRQLTAPAPPQVASSREAQMVDGRDLQAPEPDPGSLDPRYENRPLLRPHMPAGHVTPANDKSRPMSPVALRDVERPFPSMTDFPEDRARFESVPQMELGTVEAEVIESEPDDTWIETRQLDTVPLEPYVVDDLFEEDEVITSADDEVYDQDELSVHHRESALNRFLRQRRERRQPVPYRQEPSYDAPIFQEQPAPSSNAHFQSEPPETEEPVQESASPRPEVFQPTYRQPDPPQPQPVLARKTANPDVIDDDFVLPPPLPEYQPSDTVHTEAVRSARPRNRSGESVARPEVEGNRDFVTPPVADEFGDQPLFASDPGAGSDDVALGTYESDRTPAYPAARVERICRTCRDFRPAENGERGWCNNKWAFNHRRMVDADDLACRNSLGSWWTPKDDIWRRDGDISRHAQQTPRIDQWLFGSDPEEDERRRSGS